MAILSRIAGIVDAWSYAYGINTNAPVALQVLVGSTVSGTYTLTCQNQNIIGADSVSIRPSTSTPLFIGIGTNLETVTPSSVSIDNLGNLLITATFANAHGAGEMVRSGSYGLQEALNYASSIGGGLVAIKPEWFSGGGTAAVIAASVVGPNTQIWNTAAGLFAGASSVPSSVTQLAAPTALTTATSTNGMIATATTGGAIPASSTYRLGVTYVDAYGGETTLSIDTASTATIASGATSTNVISITSPAALTGAVGYRVYMSAASGASLSEILYPVGNAAITGTAVSTLVSGQTLQLPCFQIGTPVTITAIITGTAKVPAQNSAFTYGSGLKYAAPVTSYPPFTALGTIAAAATGTLGEINFPAGFFNTLGRTVRYKGTYYVTTNGTGGTVTTELILASIYGVTNIIPFTAASSSIGASALTINFEFDITMVTAAIGTSGTLECHGTVAYNVAGGTSPVGTIAMDSIQAVSSTLDLTKQNTLSVAHLNTTVGTTASQLRLLTVEVLQ